MTPEEFFSGRPFSKQLYEIVYREVKNFGEVNIQVTKSQVAFRKERNFAWVWIPGQYLKGKTAPLVLTLSYRHRDDSPRWKEIVEPAPGRFTHHLELYEPSDIDEEVVSWLRNTWEESG